MSRSIRTEQGDPRRIAGGFVLVPVRQLLFTWQACRRRPLGAGDFRAWLACLEMVARRCLIDQRVPTYGFTELARLTGVSEKRGRASINRLVAGGLLDWSQASIAFPDPGNPDDDLLADTIGGGLGRVAIPRRLLRLLADGARPTLIATAFAVLLRCLSRGRGGFRSLGRIKAGWVARVFGVDLRRVKQSRRELIDLGWLEPEPTDQWAMNRWGQAYRINLDWDRPASLSGPQLPPLRTEDGHPLPPLDSDPEPLREMKNQKPADRGTTGIETREEGGSTEPIRRGSTKPIRRGSSDPPRIIRSAKDRPSRSAEDQPSPTVPPRNDRADPPRINQAEPIRRGSTEPIRRGSTTPPSVPIPADRRPGENQGPVKAGAGGGPLPAPTLNDVRVEDLKDTDRLLQLHEQAVARQWITPSEADRLKFVAAAEHARGIGSRNPPGLFARLIRDGLWNFLTQDDEDSASRRLKRNLFGAPRRGVGSDPGLAMVDRPGLSSDAKLVREVRAASARARYPGDPFPAVHARDPSWTRRRWDEASAELGHFLSQNGDHSGIEPRRARFPGQVLPGTTRWSDDLGVARERAGRFI